MQAETQARIVAITATIELLCVHVGFEEAVRRLAELEAKTVEADFWDNQASAQEAMREKNRLERQLNTITSLKNEMEDAVGLIELGEIEGDQDIVAEAEEALAQLAVVADKRVREPLLREALPPLVHAQLEVVPLPAVLSAAANCRLVGRAAPQRMALCDRCRR